MGRIHVRVIAQTRSLEMLVLSAAIVNVSWNQRGGRADKSRSQRRDDTI